MEGVRLQSKYTIVSGILSVLPRDYLCTCSYWIYKILSWFQACESLLNAKHFFHFFKINWLYNLQDNIFSSINTCILKGTRYKATSSQPTFMTLNKLSWPSPSFSLKKSWSGKVRAMSLLISFSLGEVCFRYSTYSCLWGESCTPSNSCQARPRKWCGIPLLTSSCNKIFL